MKLKIEGMPVQDKIPNIKLLRFVGQMGLGDAKDFVEALTPDSDGKLSCEIEVHPNVKLDACRDYINDCFYRNGRPNIQAITPLSEPLAGTGYYKTFAEKDIQRGKGYKKKVKTEGNQAFNVPNNAEGHAFLRLARKFSNSPRVRLHSRGRGKRPSRRYHDALPIGISEWIALYVIPISKRKFAEEEITYFASENHRLKMEVARLQNIINAHGETDKDGVTFDTTPNAIAIRAKTTVHSIDALHRVLNAFRSICNNS